MDISDIKRMVVFGGKGVGKSAIVRRYLFQKFTGRPSNTIEDVFLHLVKRPERWFEVEIVDTAGTKEFLDLKKRWINKSTHFMVVFALDDISSLGDAIDTCAMIKEQKGERHHSIYLVGNKTDSQKRAITTEQIHRLMGWVMAGSYPYFETSALNDHNVSDLMEQFFADMALSNPYDCGDVNTPTRKSKSLLKKLFRRQ